MSGVVEAPLQRAPAVDVAAVLLALHGLWHLWGFVLAARSPEVEWVQLVVGAALTGALSASAVGLWRRRPWARTLALWICWLKIFAIVSVVAIVGYFAVESPDPESYQTFTLAWIAAWALPIVLLTLPSSRRAVGPIAC